MRQGTGAELLGPNDPRSNDIAIIHVAPADVRQDVLAAILTQDKLGKKQVVIDLPEQSKAFRQSVDFDGLKNMRRGLKAKIVFVAPAGPGPANFARQRNFEVYSSLESFANSLRSQPAPDVPQDEARPLPSEDRPRPNGDQRGGLFRRRPRPLRTAPAMVPVPSAEPPANEPPRAASPQAPGSPGAPYKPIEDVDTVDFDEPGTGAGQADSDEGARSGSSGAGMFAAGAVGLAAGAGLGALAARENASHGGEGNTPSTGQNQPGTPGSPGGSPETRPSGTASSPTPAGTSGFAASPDSSSPGPLDPGSAEPDALQPGGAPVPVPGIISFRTPASPRPRTTGKIAAASAAPNAQVPAAPEVISGQSVRPGIPNRSSRSSNSGKMAAAGVAGAAAGLVAADLAAGGVGSASAASGTASTAAASGGSAGILASGSARGAGSAGVVAPPPAPPIRPGGSGGSGRPRRPFFRRRFLILGLVLLTLLLLVGIAFAAPGGLSTVTGGLIGGPPSAKITITPKSSDLANRYDLLAVTGTPNSGNREVQARVLTARDSKSGQGNATGSIAAKQAAGPLRFLNTGISGQTISGGTLTGADGVRVSFGGPIFVPVTGSASITVTGVAVNAGAAGNIGAFDINTTCCVSGGSIHVSDPSGFGGGQDAKPNSVIQQSDIDGAAQPLIASLKQSLQANVQGQVAKNEQVVPNTFNCTQTQTADHKAGDIAPVVHVTVNVTCTEEVFDRDGALSMARSLLIQKAGTDLGPQYSLVGQIITSIQQATPVSANGQVALLVPAEGIWVYQFPASVQNGLKTKIKNLPKAQAQDTLLAQPGVAQVQIDLSTGNTLPTDVQQITIIIKNITGLSGGTPTPGAGNTPPPGNGNPTPTSTPQNGLGGS